MKLAHAIRLLALFTPLVLTGSSACANGQAVETLYTVQQSHVSMLVWSPDGSRIIFSDQNSDPRSFLSVASDGSSISEFVEGRFAGGGAGYVDNISPSIDSDGKRVVFMSYRIGGLLDLGPPTSWEIYTANADGTEVRRLTRNWWIDKNPAWSPDGSRIAFVSYGMSEPTLGLKLYTMDEDGSDVRLVTATTGTASEILRPAWSPDGSEMAFAAQFYLPTDEVSGPRTYKSYLYIVGADGSNLRSILELAVAEAVSSLAWSPDGQRLAFVINDNDRWSLDEALSEGTYTVRMDGTELTRVWREAVSQLDWSLDGDKLLINGGTYSVSPDGSSGLRVEFPYRPDGLAAWSPDGARIAFDTGDVILTAAADGTDLRPIARRIPRVWERGDARPDKYADWVAAVQDVQRAPVDLTPCSRGPNLIERLLGSWILVVPDPEQNPELVKDCEMLLSIRDALAGDADLGWNSDTPIAEWEGITINGSPLRVRELMLKGTGLTGVLPPELGQLSALKALDLSDQFLAQSQRYTTTVEARDPDAKDNLLSGTIPRELGSLTDLRVLNLAGNFLSGPVPPELGNLPELRTLGLSHNFLTGSIPSELGKLAALGELNLSVNGLAGPIPATLGNLEQLGIFFLQQNNLSGPIPTELHGLALLVELDVSNNLLSGEIPPELGRLGNLWSLNLWHNSLSGEIPPELGRLGNLGSLDLSHNSLSGEIPRELGRLGNLFILNLSHNSLSGEIPRELTQLQMNLAPNFNYNKLTGPSPEEVRSWWPDRDITLEGNPLCVGEPKGEGGASRAC